MQFVWININDPRSPNDLKVSMKSVAQFYQGEADYVVVGDVPEWFTGLGYSVKQVGTVEAHRISRNVHWKRYVDQMLKMWSWLHNPRCRTEFCWMMDDQIFVKPVTDEQLRIHRYHKVWHPQSRPWDNLCQMTIDKTRKDQGLMFGTHCMQVFRKERMLAMFRELGMPKSLWMFDVAYANRWDDEPREPVDGFFRMFKTYFPHRRKVDVVDIVDETVINWNDAGRNNPDLQDYVRNILCLSQSTPLPFASNTQISWP